MAEAAEPRIPPHHDPECFGCGAGNAFGLGLPLPDEEGITTYVAPVQFTEHHQGGPCGYQGRDYLGSPSAPGVVLENQPYAWNPSITGTKSEDTIMATTEWAAWAVGCRG